jgi:hypothetical protein
MIHLQVVAAMPSHFAQAHRSMGNTHSLRRVAPLEVTGHTVLEMSAGVQARP